MFPTLRHTAALLALSAPVFLSAALAADAQFLHPDAEVRKTYPILSKFNAGRAPSERILKRGHRGLCGADLLHPFPFLVGRRIQIKPGFRSLSLKDTNKGKI